MKTLSVRQPWAWLIIHGGKDIENRTWPSRYTGPLRIHAAKKIDMAAKKNLTDEGVKLPLTFETGGTIGTVRMTGCITKSKSKWFAGPYGFVLENPIPEKFEPASGQLGIY